MEHVFAIAVLGGQSFLTSQVRSNPKQEESHRASSQARVTGHPSSGEGEGEGVPHRQGRLPPGQASCQRATQVKVLTDKTLLCSGIKCCLRMDTGAHEVKAGGSAARSAIHLAF